MSGGAVTLTERIRRDLEGRIVSGAWPPGYRVPSEHALMAEYSCSRMTMHKVLSGIAAAGLILRRRRIGSFVAVPQGEHSVLAIEDFATESARLGHIYRHEILGRKIATLSARKAEAMGLATASRVVRLRCLHRVNGTPLAYEDRVISLATVPAAEHADFARVPPGSWLLRNVPWTEAEHVIRARNATLRLSQRLRLKANAACLVLDRRTWHQGRLVTEVTITYPGDRYHFDGRFSPTARAGNGRAEKA